MLRNTLCTFLFLGLIFCVANAQHKHGTDFTFKTYTTAQGLAENVIVKTVRDKYGFLWIATHNGLSRFDGLSFKHYTHNPSDSNSLRSIWISDLLVDDTQLLWATTEYGICYYDENKDQFVYINKPTEVQLVYKIPICKDYNNTVWVAAEDGLKKLNSLTKKFTSTSLKRIADPQFVLVLSNRELLIGTRGKGLYKYNKLKDTYRKLTVNELPADAHFMDALQDGEEAWIATSEGLLQLKADEHWNLFSAGIGELSGNKNAQLMCLKKFEAAFGESKIICGTYDKKLLLFDKVSSAFTYQWKTTNTSKESFKPAIIYSLQADGKMLWIGTNRGLLQVNLENKQQDDHLISNLVLGNYNGLVRKVLPGNQAGGAKLWMIPWQPYNGIVLLNLANNKILKEWNTVNTKKQTTYQDVIFSEKHKCVLAARDSAIDYYDETRGFIKSIPVKGNIFCLREDKKGNVWIGHDEGITYLDTEKKTQRTFVSDFKGTEVERNSYGGGFPVNSIEIINNELWLASIKYGLFNFNINSKKFTPHRQPSPADFSTRNRASSILITAADSIWVGTMAGLSCYIPSKNKFINYDASNGFKSTYIYSIVQDNEQNIWARGNADLVCFNVPSQKIIGAKPNQLYDIDCHLQKISIYNNNVLLGHEGGFSIFNSTDFVHPVATLPVAFLSGCKVNNKEIYFNRDQASYIPTVLNPFQNQISFDLNAIEFNYPEDVAYHYQLIGLDKVWLNAGIKRSISYSNLRPGTYNFSFFVINRKSHNRSSVANFAFVIKPAWWQYWWFWPLLALIFATAVIVVARKRVNAIKEKEQQRTTINKAMAELETKMLRSQMNPHFIFNSLNSIQKYIWENKEEDAAEYLARFAKLMRAILENSREETITVAEEMEVMKLYVDLEHRRSNGGFDYSIKAASHLVEKKVLIPPLIMQPFIENAIWHGLNKKGIKGNLSVTVFEKDQNLVCEIDDDGVGRFQHKETPTADTKSLGINITRQRIEKLVDSTGQYANIHIKDKSENGIAKGTTVTIILPLQTG